MTKKNTRINQILKKINQISEVNKNQEFLFKSKTIFLGVSNNVLKYVDINNFTNTLITRDTGYGKTNYLKLILSSLEKNDKVEKINIISRIDSYSNKDIYENYNKINSISLNNSYKNNKEKSFEEINFNFLNRIKEMLEENLEVVYKRINEIEERQLNKCEEGKIFFLLDDDVIENIYNPLNNIETQKIQNCIENLLTSILRIGRVANVSVIMTSRGFQNISSQIKNNFDNILLGKTNSNHNIHSIANHCYSDMDTIINDVRKLNRGSFIFFEKDFNSYKIEVPLVEDNVIIMP